MKTTVTALLLALSCAVAAPAFAKGKGDGKGTPQNHHCMKDGAEVVGKTKKECTKDGGKWEKNAAPAAAAPAPAAAPAAK